MAGVTKTLASAMVKMRSVTRGESATGSLSAEASHSHPASMRSVQVNCSTWPPPQKSSSK